MTAPPRRFYLDRRYDVSGVSGPGRVADGVLFPTGWVALGWRGRYAMVASYPSLEHVLALHGHGGRTRVVWTDPDERGRFTDPVTMSMPERPPLSEREEAVLRLVCDGLTNPEIGRRLYITEHTVMTYLRRAFHKLNARNRASAVAAAFRQGFVR